MRSGLDLMHAGYQRPKGLNKMHSTLSNGLKTGIMADDLIAEVHQGVKGIDGVKDVKVKLVFDPPWDKSMMSEEAMLELGLL